MSDLDQWRMRRETFVTILQALLGDADEDLVREGENLIFGRKRTLRTEKVERFSPGMEIEYLLGDGRTRKSGKIHKLNRFSVSVRHPHPTEGYIVDVVPVEKILTRPESAKIFALTQEDGG